MISFRLIMILFFSFLTFTSCRMKTSEVGQQITSTVVPSKSASDLVVAFGSCNNQDKKQPLWKIIAAQAPDIWIWLGDNIYGDTKNMTKLEVMYQKQKDQPDYKRFLTQDVKVLGTWDDHDYGVNDGGKEFEFKDESAKLAFDFLGYSADEPSRKTPGLYNKSMHVSPEQSIGFIMLDTRYFRDDVERVKGKGYITNEAGDILGDEQWSWLEESLKEEMDYVIIGSSIQVIPEDHRYEKWSNFPKSRKRLLDLLAKTQNKNIIILSGDRHIAEVSEIQWQGKKIIEVTSSGMTHSYETVGDEPNRHRVSKLIGEKNFGTLRFQENQVEVTIFGVGGKEYIKRILN